jgi:hypothetical protein
VARKKAASTDEEIVELLKDILIVQLGVARVPQTDIRKIVGCDIGRVNSILKHVPKEAR